MGRESSTANTSGGTSSVEQGDVASGAAVDVDNDQHNEVSQAQDEEVLQDVREVLLDALCDASEDEFEDVCTTLRRSQLPLQLQQGSAIATFRCKPAAPILQTLATKASWNRSRAPSRRDSEGRERLVQRRAGIANGEALSAAGSSAS